MWFRTLSVVRYNNPQKSGLSEMEVLIVHITGKSKVGQVQS